MNKPFSGSIDLEALAEDARRTLAQSELIVDADTVEAQFDRMAGEIIDTYGDAPLHVLAIMSGALFPASELLRRLPMPLTLDYLHATRYRGDTSGGDLVWKAAPPEDLAGRHILLVDDILDEGFTLRAICAAVRARAPASLRVAVLADKRHRRRVAGAIADFVGVEVPDRYVFGCGMDVRGYWRQLCEIRAIAEGA